MKKVLSIVLAIAMIATMSVVAFATELTAPGDVENIEVNATYADGAKVGNFKVIVEWEDMDFTYTTNATEWNVETHKWDVTAQAKWEGEGTITVTNHSNVAVTANATYQADGNNSDLVFTNNGATAIAPEVTAEGAETTAPGTAVITVKATGSIVAADAGVIGNITVAIA